VTRRFIAQRATTRAFVSWNVPLDGAPERGLSATGTLQATITPELMGLVAEDGRPVLEPWGTFLYMEEDGHIRWGGVVIDIRVEDATLTLEASGFTTYPHGIPFVGDYEAVEVDPADVVRAIWAHIQSFPDGDLGVVVEGTTSVRVGHAPEDVEFTDGAGNEVAFEAGPYRLHWTDTVDCGREIDDLATEAPFDWVEEHEWNEDRTDVIHRVRIADRISATRHDLRFVQGENVMDVVPFSLEGDDFANEVIGLGAGEGEQALRASAAIRDGRLRRAKVLERKDVRSQSRLDAVTGAALAVASDLTPVAPSIVVRDHPNAPIAAIQLGDVIHVQARAAWLGTTSFTARVVTIAHTSPTTATLTLATT
jgi:hypothetical protein